MGSEALEGSWPDANFVFIVGRGMPTVAICLHLEVCIGHLDVDAHGRKLKGAVRQPTRALQPRLHTIIESLRLAFMNPRIW